MNVAQLCKAAGISRQWLNKLVDLGEVPGVVRRENGRLQITEEPELSQWLAGRAEQTEARNRTRERLRLDRSTVKDPIEGSYTSQELADIVGCTASSIRDRAVSIPGTYADDRLTYVFNKKLGRKMKVRNVYRFPDTQELREWIRRERETKEAERKARIFRKFPRHPVAGIAKHIQTLKAEQTRVLKVHPLSEWGEMDLKYNIQELELVLKPMLTELKIRAAS
jgi:hypothetical protein